MTDDLEANDDRWWYDRGYSLGVTETKRDAVIPRLIGGWTLLGAALWDPVIAAVFLVLYTLFTLLNWRDHRAEAEHKRDRHNPGKRYAWGESGDD